MRHHLRALPWVVGIVVLLQFLFFGLLVVGAAVPDRVIVDDLAADVRNGAYGPSGAPDGMGGRSTNFTDCVAAGTGVGRPEYSVLQRATEMPRLESCRRGAEQITALAAGEAVETQPYFRYWAGYSVLTRPVLAIGGMDGVRLFAGALFTASLLGMVLLVARVTTAAYAFALVVPLLTTSNVLSVPSSGFSHALSLATLFAGVGLVAWASRFSTRWLLVAVAVAASVYNFMDLLTTPPVAWAMTVAVAVAVMYAKGASGRALLSTLVAAGVVWPAAYAVTWVSRWLFAAAGLGWGNVMDSVFGVARFRIDGEYETVDQTFGAAIPLNWETWRSLPLLPELVLGAAVLTVVVALWLGWRRDGRQAVVNAGLLGAAAAVVPVWLVLLSNHSQIHDHFVYRAIPAAIGVVVAGCVLVATRRPVSDEFSSARSADPILS